MNSIFSRLFNKCEGQILEKCENVDMIALLSKNKTLFGGTLIMSLTAGVWLMYRYKKFSFLISTNSNNYYFIDVIVKITTT